MRELVINSSLNLIRKNEPDITEEKIEIIEYGLVSIYILITKFSFIVAIAWLLGIVKELLLFTVLFATIRLTSFGLHASKSWICLVVSTIMFIGAPIICANINLGTIPRFSIGIISTLFILKNSPADTHKRPIINPKRRLFLKITSTIIASLYTFLSMTIKNSFISNCFVVSIACQAILTSPTAYKLFGLPYNNYKNYNLEND